MTTIYCLRKWQGILHLTTYHLLYWTKHIFDKFDILQSFISAKHNSSNDHLSLFLYSSEFIVHIHITRFTSRDSWDVSSGEKKLLIDILIYNLYFPITGLIIWFVFPLTYHLIREQGRIIPTICVFRSHMHVTNPGSPSHSGVDTRIGVSGYLPVVALL